MTINVKQNVNCELCGYLYMVLSRRSVTFRAKCPECGHKQTVISIYDVVNKAYEQSRIEIEDRAGDFYNRALRKRK